MESTCKKIVLPKRLAVYVRFSEEEFKKLLEASRTVGKTLPTILKDHYFEKPIGRPLMANDMAKSVARELNRIGNNVNQIAKLVNSGIYEGWHQEFKEFHQNFARVYQLIASYSRK